MQIMDSECECVNMWADVVQYDISVALLHSYNDAITANSWVWDLAKQRIIYNMYQILKLKTG